MEKTTFCHFVSFFQNGKRNDEFQARRFGLKTKQRFPFISKTKRNDNKKIKTCPTLFAGILIDKPLGKIPPVKKAKFSSNGGKKTRLIFKGD